MVAVDPTYPLYPLTCILASTGVLLVLLTSFVRHNWNLGVTFLCFWLFVETLTGAIDTILWSDNADIKFYVYCDIVSRLQVITSVVKPMSTFIITRRLYTIASLQSVELPDKSARRWNLLVEWSLGLFIPLLIGGPIYYIDQVFQFQVLEGFGCTNAAYPSVFYIVIIQSWAIIPPILSIMVYYPRVVRIFYRQSRDINSFLRSNGSITRTKYLRILALASIDLLLTLPIGIVGIVLDATSLRAENGHGFYPGWTAVHSTLNWEPQSTSYADLQASGTATLALQYFGFWTSPILAFAVFGLFGLTDDARASYWYIVCTICGWFGWTPAARTGNSHSSMGSMEFCARPQDMVMLDAETGSHPSFIEKDMIPSGRKVDDCSQGSALARKAESVELDDTETNSGQTESSRHKCASNATQPGDTDEGLIRESRSDAANETSSA
ncbi:STE3-domain-containing protein [Peniophora sp. CONT]|nr:STE3-domain-containing protein [Peniophora sp. CONT]